MNKRDRDDDVKQLIIDFQSTFDTDNGKRVLAKLRSLTTFHRSNVSAARDQNGQLLKIDTNRLLYDEGQRMVILYIDRLLGLDPNKKKQNTAKE